MNLDYSHGIIRIPFIDDANRNSGVYFDDVRSMDSNS